MPQRRGVPVWVLAAVPILLLVLFLMIAPLLVRERDGRPNVCLGNVKWVALAMQMYVGDNGDHFPPARYWQGTLREYLPNRDVFRCPSAKGKSGYDYAYNSAWSGRVLVPVVAVGSSGGQPASDSRAVILESDAGRNASGGRKLLPSVPRHLGGDNYGFADGHAAWAKRKAWGMDQRGNPNWLKEPESPMGWQP